MNTIYVNNTNKLTKTGFLGYNITIPNVVRTSPTTKQETLKKPLADGEGVRGERTVRLTSEGGDG